MGMALPSLIVDFTLNDNRQSIYKISSFSLLFARAQGFQKTNMPSTERSFYLLNNRTICVIFLYNCMQCIDGSSIYYNDMLQKVTMQRTQHF